MRPLASPSSSMPLLAVAVVSLFTLQQLRLFITGLAFAVRDVQGLGAEVTGLVGLVVVALALLGVLLVADMNRSMVVVLVVSVVIARFITQIAGEPLVQFGVAGLGAVLGTIAISAIASVMGGREAGAGVVLGGAADVSLMTMRHTLDVPHSSSIGGFAIVFGLAVVALVAVMGEGQMAGLRRPGPIAASAVFSVGAWMAIHLTFSGNLGYIGSVTGANLLVSSAIAAGGLVLVLAWAAPGQAPPHPALSAVVAAGALVALAGADGGLAGFLVAIVAIGAGATVATAFDRDTTGSRDQMAWGAGAGLVAAYVALSAVHLPQIGVALPPTAVHVIVALPLVIAGIGAVATIPAPITPWRTPLLIAAGLAVLGLAVEAADGAPSAQAAAGDPFVMTFNLHSGIGLDGAVDLESMARIIESTDPDVVALQEVSRGLVATGGVDMAVWLEHRLGVPIEFAPSMARQWGVAVASRLPTDPSAVMDLGSLENGVQRVVLDVPVRSSAGQIRVLSTQLDEIDVVSDAARQAQMDDLIVAWGGSTNVVIAGDLGASFDDAIPLSLRSAGLDNAGLYASTPVLTVPSVAPSAQHDFIFVGGSLGISSIRVLEHVASDHLAVQARVGAGGVRTDDAEESGGSG